MRIVSSRCVAALVAALAVVAAGCGPEEDPKTGSISVVVTGAGAGLGLTGNLLLFVRDAELAPVASDNSLYAKTLEEGVPLAVPAFRGLAPGSYFVEAYLDRDGSVDANTGDVVSVKGYPGYTAEVRAGEETLVVVTLSYVL